MDAEVACEDQDSIVVTGAGAAVVDPVNIANLESDLLPWLRSKKTKKFMGRQDKLGVIAAGRAVKAALAESVDKNLLRDHTGIYAAIGFIPFERADIEILAQNSALDGSFSMQRFSTDGFDQVNPLLTFRCLPNMPIFHISLNLEIQGPYFVTYPGAAQFYLALEQAICALQQREIDLALVGAVADQNNFLVAHHLKRLPGLAERTCVDAGAFLCLERRAHAAARGAKILMELISYQIGYQAEDPYNSELPHLESLTIAGDSCAIDKAGYLGAASLPVFLSEALRDKQQGELIHRLNSIDGFSASSCWRLL